jgi:KUP system potassium uptake protein
VVSKVNSVVIFSNKVGDMVPIVFTRFVRKFCARLVVVVFCHMHARSTPSIPEAERYAIQRTSILGCYRITIRHGYTDLILSPDLAHMLTEQLVLNASRDQSSASSASSVSHLPRL